MEKAVESTGAIQIIKKKSFVLKLSMKKKSSIEIFLTIQAKFKINTFKIDLLPIGC